MNKGFFYTAAFILALNLIVNVAWIIINIGLYTQNTYTIGYLVGEILLYGSISIVLYESVKEYWKYRA